MGKHENPKHERGGRTEWLIGLKKNNLKPILDVVDIVPYNEKDFWEKHYISLYRSWGFELKNSTHGGSGVSLIGGMGADAREQISIKNKGNTGRKVGHKLTPQQCKEASETMKRVWKDKPFPVQAKPILQYDLQMNFIKEWISPAAVRRELKIYTSDRVARGEFAQAGGFIWRYKKDV